MKHPRRIENYNGTLQELARDICNLDYVAMQELFSYCVNYLHEDAVKDFERGRPNLSRLINSVALSLFEVTKKSRRLADFCKPYMED